MSRQVQVNFVRLPRIVAAVRETAETVRTYGLDADGGWGIARGVPLTLHMIAAELESEWRCWITRDVAHRLSTGDPTVVKAEELRVGEWSIEPTNLTPASYVAYPEPDLATRAQKLSGAAESLRIQAVVLDDALEAPCTAELCQDLRHVAERINTFAGTLTDNASI